MPEREGYFIEKRDTDKDRMIAPVIGEHRYETAAISAPTRIGYSIP